MAEALTLQAEVGVELYDEEFFENVSSLAEF